MSRTQPPPPNPLLHLLGWIGRHVRGFYAALGTYLLLGLAGVLGGALLFVALAALMEGGLTQRFDDAVLLWMHRHSAPWLDVLALEVTALGSSMVVWTMLLVTSAILWATRHRYSVLLLWAAFLGGTLLNLVLKAEFDRPRPDLFPWRVPYAGHSSFPSGHSTTATVVYVTLALLISRLTVARAARRVTLALAALLVLCIGASRMYLGVHYPSDVLGGIILGIGWAAFCALGIEAVRYFRRRRPRADAEEEGLDDAGPPPSVVGSPVDGYR